MHLKRTLTALVLSMTGIFALNPLVAPAHAADWDHTLYTQDEDPGGRLQFARHGDQIRVCDIQADDYYALVEVSRAADGFFHTLSARGDGECDEADEVNLKEGKTYHFTLCLVKNGVKRFCNQRDWISG